MDRRRKPLSQLWRSQTGQSLGGKFRHDPRDPIRDRNAGSGNRESCQNVHDMMAALNRGCDKNERV